MKTYTNRDRALMIIKRCLYGFAERSVVRFARAIEKKVMANPSIHVLDLTLRLNKSQK